MMYSIVVLTLLYIIFDFFRFLGGPLGGPLLDPPTPTGRWDIKIVFRKPRKNAKRDSISFWRLHDCLPLKKAFENVWSVPNYNLKNIQATAVMKLKKIQY